MSKHNRRRGGAKPFSAVVLALLALATVAVMVLRVSALKRSEAAETGNFSEPTPGAAVQPVSGANPTAATVEATPVPGGESTEPPEPTAEPEPEYYTISMVGDCTLAEAKTRRGWGSAYQTVVGKNYAYPFANTRSYFEDDYLTIANLECVLSDKYYDSIEQFVFLAPAAYANILSEGSVEFVTLANNHTMDFGSAGYNDTAAALDAAGVLYAGENETYIYQRSDGVKIGIYCLYNRLTGNMLGTLSADSQQKLASESREWIAQAEKALREQGAQFTVACLHMGTEGSYETSEIQVDTCRFAIDSGFDMVYCTHAHRLQPAEEYNGGVILYGLGNWSFGGHTNPGNGTDAAAYDTGIAQVKLCRRGDRVTLESFRFIPCCISSYAGTELDSFVPGPNTLNNYQPTPYLENGEAWKRTMSILDGAYAGANFVPSYWTILDDMNAG